MSNVPAPQPNHNDVTESSNPSPEDATKAPQETATELQLATFGSGCFWCTEAILDSLEGVERAVSGYMGGEVPNPTYRDICTGLTGHAEVVQVKYDPKIVSYADLLNIFWKTHDPTTLNRQGYDVGTQYRSVVFFHNEEQQALAEYYKQQLDSAGAFDDPIVTEISKASKFYEAEKYHQDYFALNPSDRYCQAVIVPKMGKFLEVFGDKLKRPND